MMYLRSCALFLLISSVYSITMDKYYDHFVYTQQWAESVCSCYTEANELDGKDVCKIPKNIKTWTIHGLWPTNGTTLNPAYCNNSWHFDEDQILKIENDLELHWPQLLVSSSRISFWAHEWEKHGTCCTDLSWLDSEFKYFNNGLNLNKRFNLTSIFEKAGITPSKTKSYKLADIHNAIEKFINGSKPYIHCCKGKDGKQRIEEVMICLDKKKFAPMDCSRGDQDCNEDLPVYYEPINPTRPNFVTINIV